MLDQFRNDLMIFLRSHRFWLTFAAVVLLFAITGPFGTAERWGFAARLGYWFTHQLAAWATAILFVILANIFLERLIPSAMARMLTGAALSAFPIGLAIGLVQSSWSGAPLTAATVLEDGLMSLPLTLIFSVVTYMAMSGQGQQAPSGMDKVGLAPAIRDDRPPSIPDPAIAPVGPAPILSRLKPEMRGELLALSVEDHYTVVTTTRGRSMILMRLSDAIGEAGTTEGIQVHRSHWVADRFVKGVTKHKDKLILSCADGSEIPVSRSFRDAVRARFAG